MKRKLTLLVFGLFLMTGCSGVREVRFDSMQEVLKRQGTHPNKHLGNNLHEVVHQPDAKEKRVMELEAEIEKMPTIETANVVIIENAAIISVNFKGDASGSSLSRLKKEVKQRVREVDKTLRYISVTASPEILDKLYEISDNDKEGGQGAYEITRLRPQI